MSNPVPPSIVNRDNSDMSEDNEEILGDLAYYVCDTVCKSKAKLNSHIQLTSANTKLIGQNVYMSTRSVFMRRVAIPVTSEGRCLTPKTTSLLC